MVFHEFFNPCILNLDFKNYPKSLEMDYDKNMYYMVIIQV